MTDPTTLKLAENIGAARGTDYFLMKEQLTKDEVELLYKVFWGAFSVIDLFILIDRAVARSRSQVRFAVAQNRSFSRAAECVHLSQFLILDLSRDVGPTALSA